MELTIMLLPIKFVRGGERESSEAAGFSVRGRKRSCS